jgi:hypothetical protein
MDARQLEPYMDARQLEPVKKAKWVVYAKRPFAGPEQVLDYVGRYTHRDLEQSLAGHRSRSSELPI